jgi:glycerol-3-phosphate dehydrogenase (NAD(P)+)
MKKVAVLGTGGWGTAMAIVAARRGLQTVLWGRRADRVEEIRRTRENRPYLPGVPLPDSVEITSDPGALAGVDAVVCAVPTQHVRATVGALRDRLPSGMPLLSLGKGIEIGTLDRPSQILGEALDAPRVTALSGPSHAEEVARELPATVVVAANQESEAQRWQQALTGMTLRLYSSDDLVGVELAGALKNVIAIAAGICDGLKLGDNAKAALLSRGVVEMARLGTALGARKSTFFGISGIGDLIATCTSPHGRNLRVGRAIGSGRTLKETLADSPMVAEGVWTCTAARDLARKHGIELPITEEVCRILHEGKPPLEGLKSLMSRLPKSESADLS